MVKRIVTELKRHAPFTAVGALTGIIFMIIVLSGNFLPPRSPMAQHIFYILHPTHVILSALASTAMYMKYGKGKIWVAILIGYTGSVGIATLSDSVIPFAGETLLNLPYRGIHLGFIEEWWVVNPAALLGIVIGCYKQITKFPHFGHVLISTWASLFHIIMALGETVNRVQITAILLFLFLAVWVPCCTSDIVYPLLFRREPSSQGIEECPHT